MKLRFVFSISVHIAPVFSGTVKKCHSVKEKLILDHCSVPLGTQYNADLVTRIEIRDYVKLSHVVTEPARREAPLKLPPPTTSI